MYDGFSAKTVVMQASAECMDLSTFYRNYFRSQFIAMYLFILNCVPIEFI